MSNICQRYIRRHCDEQNGGSYMKLLNTLSSDLEDMLQEIYEERNLNSNSKLNDYWKLCCLVPLVIIHNISMLAFIWKIFNEEVNTFDVAYMIPANLVCIQTVLEVATILSNKSDIEALINDLIVLRETLNLTDEQMKVKKLLTKRLKIYLALFYWINVIATVLHMSWPLTSVLFHRFILGQDYEFVLPVECVYPYEPTDSWFKYLATYLFQAYILTCECYAYFGSQFLIITLCANIAIEFAILREDLLHVEPYSETDNPRNQMEIGLAANSTSNTTSIQYFIRRHQMLIRYAKRLDDIFNKIIFINLLFLTGTLCFYGFATMVARDSVDTMKYFVAVLSLLFPSYTLCYYAELLKNESSGIAETVYDNEWYRGDMRYQKLIYFIMARSQRPCCLTSLRYIPVTMSMYTTVLGTTWSYFSFARSIYSRGQ